MRKRSTQNRSEVNMTQFYDERLARREFMYQRKRFVLSSVAVGVGIAFVLALIVQCHLFGIAASKTPEVDPNYGVQAPCPVKNKDENKAQYIDNRAVSIRVLNGTKFRGFARAVGEGLRNRGFNLIEVGNSETSVKRTTIYFGKQSINEAYTLVANFKDAILRMDNRQDKLVDVVLGSTFSNLRPKTDVPAAGAAITEVNGCLASKDMKDLPKAANHKPIN